MAKSFSDDVNAFILGFEKGTEETMRVTAAVTFEAIIKDTPVDEGRARANWFATGAKPSARTTNNEDKSGDSAATKAASVVAGLKDWHTFKLTNNLPYINHLEFGLYNQGPNTVMGYSSQAKAGMVRINILKSQMLLEKQAKKRLPK